MSSIHESVMTDHITKTGRDSLTEQTSKQTHSPMNRQQIWQRDNVCIVIKEMFLVPFSSKWLSLIQTLINLVPNILIMCFISTYN